MLHSVQSKQVTATTGHVLIEHTLRDEWYFATHKQADLKLQDIAKFFVTEHTAQFDVPQGSLVLWIKGYDTTPEDRTRGYMGHFAHIYATIGDDGFWTLKAEKIRTGLARHPMRSKRSKFPSWANPVLKEIMSGKVYPTQAAAQNALQALHEGYPEASTPGVGKLSICIASKLPTGEQNKQHCIFLCGAAPEGKQGVVITMKDVTKQITPKAEPEVSNTSIQEVAAPSQEQPSVQHPQAATPQAQAPVATPTPKGYFASMVEMKKKKPR